MQTGVTYKNDYLQIYKIYIKFMEKIKNKKI